MRYRCEVYIQPRKDILDPQGDAVSRALSNLGYAMANEVRIGKYLTLSIEADNSAQAESLLREMCGKLLANPITEDFTLRVTE